MLCSISRSLRFSLMGLWDIFFHGQFCGLVRGSGRCFVGSFSHVLFPTSDACVMQLFLQMVHVGYEHLASLRDWKRRPTDRQLAARRFLVLIFLSLAHILTEQGQEICAHSIFCKSTLLNFFKSVSYEIVNEYRIENCLGLCNYQVSWAEKKNNCISGSWILS